MILSKVLFFVCLCSYLIWLAMFTVAPEYKAFNLSVLSFAIALSFGLSFFKRVDIYHFLKTRLFKELTSSLITISLCLCILGMINYLVYKNDYSVDFTQAKYHSLSNQSIDLTKKLCQQPSNIKFTLYAKRSDWGRFLKMLDLYKRSCKKIDLSAIDVETNPALVSINNISENGTLLIEVNNKKYRVTATTEQLVTSLIAKIINPSNVVLYYIIGHNESSFKDASQTGLSYLQKQIENTGYALKPLSLHEGIPSDASGVLLLNPQLSFLDREVKILENYIYQGGNFLSLFSPQFSENNLQNLHSMIEKLGVRFINGLILDRLASTQGAQASIPIVNKYPSNHLITKDLKGRTLFPLSAFFEVNNPYWTILASSSPFPASWGEVSFSEVKSGKATFKQDVDFKGPLPILVAREFNDSKSRIVLFSSTNFVTNQYQGHANNFNLFLNTISWIVNDENLITIDRPNLNMNLVYLSDIQYSFVFYFAILLFPFLFFGIGIIMYKRKLSR